MRKLNLKRLNNLPKSSHEEVVKSGFELRVQIQHHGGPQGINEADASFVNLLLVAVGGRTRTSPILVPVLCCQDLELVWKAKNSDSIQAV